jgi:xanthine dehydrogenase iron-sulfur cluster and FAD-binding subunit A
MYQFEKLEVYQTALTYTDMVYSLAEKLPKSEEYNLKSQIVRAATSIVLNIAEGSTGQGDTEETVLGDGPSVSDGNSGLSAPK